MGYGEKPNNRSSTEELSNSFQKNPKKLENFIDPAIEDSQLKINRLDESLQEDRLNYQRDEENQYCFDTKTLQNKSKRSSKSKDQDNPENPPNSEHMHTAFVKKTIRPTICKSNLLKKFSSEKIDIWSDDSMSIKNSLSNRKNLTEKNNLGYSFGNLKDDLNESSDNQISQRPNFEIETNRSKFYSENKTPEIKKEFKVSIFDALEPKNIDSDGISSQEGKQKKNTNSNKKNGANDKQNDFSEKNSVKNSVWNNKVEVYSRTDTVKSFKFFNNENGSKFNDKSKQLKDVQNMVLKLTNKLDREKTSR